MSSIRQTLADSITFVRSVEANKAASAVTLDHLIDEQIKNLKKGEQTQFVDAQGNSVGSRPSKWDVIDALQQEIASTVKTLQDAGSDPEKLAALGLYDAATADQQSTNVGGA